MAKSKHLSITKPGDYYFLHFHKCAGTYIVQSFQDSGYLIPTIDWNGKNTSMNGNVISKAHSHELGKLMEPQWQKIPVKEQVEIIRQVRVENEPHLIASERRFPSPQSIRSALANVQIFTVVRDPWSRLVSNYKFSMRRRKRMGKTIQRFSEFRGGIFSTDNFYLKTILGKPPKSEISESDFHRAIDWLEMLDFIIIQESGQIERWLQSVGINPATTRKNKGSLIPELVFDVDKNAFKSSNAWDYKFYQHAVNKTAWQE